MESIQILFILLIFLICIALYLIIQILKVRRQLETISVVLDDIEQGNINRRLITKNGDMTAKICYKINKIVMNNKEQFIKFQNTEQAYKKLMTSLSHDVRTPLTSLIGYLDAIHNEIVTGKEKDNYIEVARNKAYTLKDFVDMLFEWMKLDSKERIFLFEKTDVNELSRSIILDWIPMLEQCGFTYNFIIPETELFLNLDTNAFTRILNNLIQNVIVHSNGNSIDVEVVSQYNSTVIKVSDNGKGISECDLPHVFDRLYKCDKSRSIKGSGLGLSIVRELVKAHSGKIEVFSIPNQITIFKVILPLAL
ncbi:sensor histidine kinase [Oceanirhabdus seepicola]|uniref:histidine kinase n=1 Tax=Oceanirhabdus seepicola TaxID=2828781 RepID=A0A9J6P8V8_9CLOT|nr:HAMP domain-containing sensor histidine kinase [Oceanirhabdus seepicola]MCM1992422.1 HAMP domain-containing histidine kinase [Oceanirhabdus seepicola]